jgi:hypothetical protein
MKDFDTEIAEIKEQLKEKTLGELQAEMKTGRIDYSGAGFGYQLQDNYPKTWEEAEQDVIPAGYEELVKDLEAL